MAKKTLEKKIKLVWIWALILSVVYFAIGAYLKSDGPKFDPSKTYELLKDTLTLTATFLAPVAAFVLFSDWRHEFAVKNLHSTIDKIKITTRTINERLNNYFQNIQKLRPRERLKFEELADFEQITLLINDLRVARMELQDDKLTTQYANTLDEFLENSKEAKKKLYSMEFAMFSYRLIQVNSKGTTEPSIKKSTLDRELSVNKTLYTNKFDEYKILIYRNAELSVMLMDDGIRIQNEI